MSACADAEVAERISEDVDAVDVVDVVEVGGEQSVEVDPGVIDQVEGVACGADFRTMSLAVEAFWALEGRAPTAEDQLVGTFLREPSSGYDISPDGEVVPAPGSPCS